MDPDYVPIFSRGRDERHLEASFQEFQACQPVALLHYTSHVPSPMQFVTMQCTTYWPSQRRKATADPCPPPDAVRNVRVYSVQKNTVRSMTNGRWKRQPFLHILITLAPGRAATRVTNPVLSYSDAYYVHRGHTVGMWSEGGEWRAELTEVCGFCRRFCMMGLQYSTS
jgi:hypothetical protein